MDRKQYISTEWKKYSFSPENYQVCGLLKSYQTKSDSLILSIRDQDFEVSVSMQKSLDYKYIQAGDDVAITKENQIELLVPRDEDSPRINFQQQWLWSRFLQHIKDFFTENNFLEIYTSSLVANPGPEPTLEVFETEYLQGSKSRKLFLPTSPEIEIKKKLTSLVRQVDQPKVFEITRSYRNSEWTERHRPEFFILEWYRTYKGLDAIQNDILEMLQVVGRKLKMDLQEKKWSFHLNQSFAETDRKSVKELFRAHLNFDLHPATKFAELKSLAEKNKIDIHSAENFDDAFFLLYLHKIEHQWDSQKLFFVEKYPPSQAALARLDEQGWGERFEFYWQGFEIANAFCELNDPEIQAERLKKDLQEKIRQGRKEIPFDEEFIQALQKGLPPTSGIALGLERLFMAFLGIKSFEDLHLAHIQK